MVVGEYVNDLVRDAKAYATITRRVAAIGFCQQLATGHKVTRDPLVTTALAGARRLLAGRGTRQAAPLRLAELRAIVTGLPIVAPNRPTMRRDQLGDRNKPWEGYAASSWRCGATWVKAG